MSDSADSQVARLEAELAQMRAAAEKKAEQAQAELERLKAKKQQAKPRRNGSAGSADGKAAAGIEPDKPRRRTAAPAGKNPPPKAAADSRRDPDALIDDEVVETRGYRSLFRTLGSCTFSVIVHMSILIIMGLWILPYVIPVTPELSAIQPRDEEELTQIVDERITPATEMTSSAQSESALTSGHISKLKASEPTFDSESVVEQSETKVNVGPLVDPGAVSGSTLTMEVPDGAVGDPQAVVNSMDEAMDRITREILLMLEKSKVLVVWLFDESESMKDEQKLIRNKVERVYAELGLRGATKGDALTTAIASYGAKPNVHTQTPTYDLDRIRAAIDRVPVDESGKENMCGAVGSVVTYFKKFTRGRQMALILVTDESGDMDSNRQLLEPTISAARAARCRIYCLGRESVFGYPYAYLRWKDPKTAINYWLRIDRGPETPDPEQLQTNGFWRRHDAHASGFGPYEQARMCRETGGVFFMLPSPEVNLVRRDDRKYALARLRPYMPSLETRQHYNKERGSSKLRGTLWKVIQDLNPWNPAQARHINMRDDFSIDPAEFRRQAQIEMQKAQRYVIYLDAAEKALEALGDERRKEIYPRWQANYDLIFAQVLAYKVRIYQYGAYLDFFIKNPKKPSPKPPNPRLTLTHWDIGTRQELLETPLFPKDKTDAYIKRASEMLRQIMKDHEGTPWATRAQWELARGFGVHLMQAWDDPRRGQGVKLPKP